MTLELVAAVTAKCGLVWVRTPGAARADPTWHHWHDGAAYVLAGGAEQPVRGLADAVEATVTVRAKTTGERVLTWQARVRRVAPGSAEWAEVVPGLHAARLNSPDGPAALVRWARDSTLFRLEPTGDLVDLPDDSGAAPPPPTPATTAGPLPFVLGRRRRASQ
jgi:hypothetical protein